jgi:putative two-component system response regulator
MSITQATGWGTSPAVSTEEPVLTDMRLLIVDDLAFNVALMKGLLREGGFTNVESTRDAFSVQGICESLKPDLVLLDFHMPGASAIDVLRSIDHLVRGPDRLPVLIVTSDPTAERRHESLSAGARDFVTKPIDEIDLMLRVRTHLLTRHLQREAQHRADVLDETVRDRTAELEQARLESLTILASVTEYHDDDTHQHTQRVGATAAMLARSLRLPEPFVAAIRSAAPLHDIGKVGIPNEILLKPGPLSDEERAVMMRHAAIGPKMLEAACSPVLRLAAEIAGTHHERWDGNGYLLGLSGEDIPVSGRITAVADVFDALTHARPYKQAWSRDRALAEIADQAGRQFDSQVVAALLGLDFDELASIAP